MGLKVILFSNVRIIRCNTEFIAWPPIRIIVASVSEDGGIYERTTRYRRKHANKMVNKNNLK